MIGIIDYGAGNLHSVEKAVKRLGYPAKLLSRPQDFRGVDKVIFPGVGNARKTMEILREKELAPAIVQSIQSDMPFLGICLGMQLLMEYSKENDADGLSVFDGGVLPFKREVKVPHMGWNGVTQRNGHPLFLNIPDGTDFYFVHSYYVEPVQESAKTGTTHYGHDFCSVISKDHVAGVQFHPEKSAEAGLTLIENFCRNF